MADQPLEEPAETEASPGQEPSHGDGAEKNGSEGTARGLVSAEGAERPLADPVKDLRQEAEAVLGDTNGLLTAWLQEAREAREESLALREGAREEARRVIDEAHRTAAELLQPAMEAAAARTDRKLQEAEVTVSNMIKAAATEAQQLVAEARRTEARILLDARARTDDVRSRLIRLYNEMEAAAATWGSAGAGGPLKRRESVASDVEQPS